MTDSQRKTYVLDTSVLLSSPRAMFAFAEHEVVLPLVVIKELESKRHDPELGLPARQALRALEALRLKHATTSLREGVPVNDEGGTVRIEINHINQSGLPDALASDRTHDTRILAVASALHGEQKNVTLVSKDLPMRLLAETLGLPAEEFLHEQVKWDETYTGITKYTDVPKEHIDRLYSHGSVVHDDEKALINDGVILQCGSQSALGVVTAPGVLTKVAPDVEAFGVRGRSAEQRIALAHLLNPDVGIVSLGGPAGTGKTMLALAAGLDAVLEQDRFKRVIVFRPLFAVGGQDLGFLPGTEEDKMNPWAAAVTDALKAITTEKSVLDHIKERGLLEVLPLTHIRGRTLTDSFIIIDEAQNLERQVLLTALSRLGHNSKVALSWDVAQRDNLRVGRHDGIHAVVERLKGNPLFAHTSLVKSERSPIAAMVTNLLDDFDF
jgi:PhoH-like ATPase